MATKKELKPMLNALESLADGNPLAEPRVSIKVTTNLTGNPCEVVAVFDDDEMDLTFNLTEGIVKGVWDGEVTTVEFDDKDDVRRIEQRYLDIWWENTSV